MAKEVLFYECEFIKQLFNSANSRNYFISVIPLASLYYLGACRSWAVNEKIFSTAIAIATATATATAIATAIATATVKGTRYGKVRNEMLRHGTILRESWLLQPFNRASINTQNVARKSPSKYCAQKNRGLM